MPVEPTGSRFCSMRLLEKYLRVRPYTVEDKPLFLASKGGEMSVAAVSAVIKCMIEHAGIKGNFTAYSLRIGSVTAAIKGGMSLTQIRTIGVGIQKRLCYI